VSGHVLVAAMNIMEEASGGMGFEWLDLTGLGPAVASRRDEWMPALSEIVQRYQKRMTPGPEMRLFMSLAGIVFVVNASNKSKTLVGGGIPGKIIGSLLGSRAPAEAPTRVPRPSAAELHRNRPRVPDSAMGVFRRTKRASEEGMRGFEAVASSSRVRRERKKAPERSPAATKPKADWEETLRRLREIRSDTEVSDSDSGSSSDSGSEDDLRRRADPDGARAPSEAGSASQSSQRGGGADPAGALSPSPSDADARSAVSRETPVPGNDAPASCASEANRVDRIRVASLLSPVRAARA
jgi:hypothetical protein